MDSSFEPFLSGGGPLSTCQFGCSRDVKASEVSLPVSTSVHGLITDPSLTVAVWSWRARALTCVVAIICDSPKVSIVTLRHRLNTGHSDIGCLMINLTMSIVAISMAGRISSVGLIVVTFIASLFVGIHVSHPES